jgi:hypothetical protein
MDQDAKIAATSAVAKALEPLDGLVRRRVISRMASRFDEPLLPSSQLFLAVDYRVAFSAAD